MAQQPLELILARNLIASIEVAGFLINDDGDVVFYNEAAGAILGRRFEEDGRLTREQWNTIGPLDEQGEPIYSKNMPLRTVLRQGHPAHGRFRIRTDQGAVLEIETSALPLIGADGFRGAMLFFWAANGE